MEGKVKSRWMPLLESFEKEKLAERLSTACGFAHSYELKLKDRSTRVTKG
jgi:hypothetical protein